MEIIFATLENVAHEADGQNEHYAPEQNVPEQFRIAIRTMVVSVMPATDRIYSFETGVVRLHVVFTCQIVADFAPAKPPATLSVRQTDTRSAHKFLKASFLKQNTRASGASASAPASEIAHFESLRLIAW
jgi:hypothetical protein